MNSPLCFSQTMMTVRSGASVISCVRIDREHTTVAVLTDTYWSKATSAKPMCQVQAVARHTAASYFICPIHFWSVGVMMQKTDFHCNIKQSLCS